MKVQSVYLHDILQRIDMIEEFILAGREDFFESTKTQESTLRCFEIIGEIIKRLDADLLARQPHIEWRRFSGFRDVLIHQYDAVNLETVWDIIQNDLPPLKTAVQALLDSLPEDEAAAEGPHAPAI